MVPSHPPDDFYGKTALMNQTRSVRFVTQNLISQWLQLMLRYALNYLSFSSPDIPYNVNIFHSVIWYSI